MKSVSVHIVTFNSEAFISDCIDSILKQQYPIRKIVVVDNHSTDRTVQQLLRYGDHITVIENHTNTGFAAAHNQAIHMTDSDYFLVLNPDVCMHPEYICRLVEQFEENPKLGSATGKLVYKHDINQIDSTGLIMNKARRAFDRGAGQQAEAWEHSDIVFGVSGAAAMYSRSMVNDISINGEFFDVDFFAYKEDVDVAWRALLMGWEAAYEPKAHAIHARGWKKEGRPAIPVPIRRYSYINRYKMMIKNDSFKYLLMHLPSILFYEVASLVYFLVREPRILGAWLSFFKQYKELKRKRKWIQSKRKAPYAKVYDYFE